MIILTYINKLDFFYKMIKSLKKSISVEYLFPIFLATYLKSVTVMLFNTLLFMFITAHFFNYFVFNKQTIQLNYTSHVDC